VSELGPDGPFDQDAATIRQAVHIGLGQEGPLDMTLVAGLWPTHRQPRHHRAI